MGIMRMISLSTRRVGISRWKVASNNQGSHQLAFHSSKRRIVAAVGCTPSDTDNILPSASMVTSKSDACSKPNNNLALVAAASATVSILGFNHASSISDGNHSRYNNQQQQIIFARGYHSSIASCESNTSFPSNTSNKESDGDDNSKGSKSDSFFDMAQQLWANDSTLSRNQSTSSESNAYDPNVDSAKDKSQRSDNKPILKSPEELLNSMGILGGSGRTNRARTGTDMYHDEKENQSKKDTETPNNNGLEGMMKKVLFKFDEFQSSLPKSSLSVETEESISTTDKSQSTVQDSTENSSSIFSDFVAFANKAESLFQRKSSDAPPDIEDLIQQAQSIANRVPTSPLSNSSSLLSSQDSSLSSTGFLSQILYFQQNAKAIQQAFESSFGPHLSNINVKDLFKSLPLTAMHYYLEYQDSIKTPSWKRRIHRFQRDVEVMKVEELNEALILSELSYADSVDEIRAGLERLYNNSGGNNDKKKKNIKPQWELLFCDTKSRPNEPSHFLAIQKNASPYDDTLHVLMVVRGTKSMSDLITDAMMDATDYEYTIPDDDKNDRTIIHGKAHSGMVRSGKYLVDRHRTLLQTLLKLSKKRKLEVTLIGHSLGAGAATIAAMEWNSKPFETEEGEEDGSKSKNDIQISAHVVGFGCPALLSQPLSLATKDYVTTVIADADFIPRMSGATLVNLLLDVRKFDYRSQAERDVEQALRELQCRFSGSSNRILPQSKSKSNLPFNIDEDDIQTVMGYVHRGLNKMTASSSSDVQQNDTIQSGKEIQIHQEEVEKMLPVLFPPGDCIHFYRDGIGISGTYVSCNFFNEIDVARTMIEDHLISSGYRRIFLNLMRDFHKDDHFSFESKGLEN